MYKIFIKDLELFGYHGVHDFEKEEGQPFIFNITVIFSKDNLEDSLEKTINYSNIIKIIKDVNRKHKFNLIETLAKVISEKILKLSIFIEKVIVNIKKPDAPIKEKFNSVGIEFTEKNNFLKGKNCYLSLGSNIGNREQNLREAINKISEHRSIFIKKLSSIYKTEPMYEKNQEFFYNMVILAKVGNINPFEFLGFLKSIEYGQGRRIKKRYGPRIIDIDIIYWESFKIDSKFLTIPHPKYRERNFVLLPLKEVNPNFKIDGVKIDQYLKKKNYNEKVKLVKKIL